MEQQAADVVQALRTLMTDLAIEDPSFGWQVRSLAMKYQEQEIIPDIRY